ncbi:MAG: type II and III secretion system protein family protein [Janthinobacterium lividum]
MYVGFLGLGGAATLPGQTPQGSDGMIQVAEATAVTTHLELGHTLMLNAKARINRIYIANPAVLESYIVTPHEILLTAKTAGLTSVVLWDETNHTETYMVSCDLDPAPLRKALGDALPGEQVAVEVHQSKIMLEGAVTTQAASDTAEKIAALFNKDVVNSLVVSSAKARQVELKVRFVEIDRSRLNQFGINIFAPGGTSSVGSGSTQQFSTTTTLTTGSGTGLLAGANVLNVSNPLNFLFYSSKANVGVSVQDLENKQVLQILAEPTITTLSGQSADFLAGGEFPFPVVQGASTGATSITIQFRPFGVRLAFTPRVNPDGSIELKVSPEVSALDYTNAVSISGYTIPAISTKHVDTQVVLHSGQSFAISGLLDRRTTDSLARTPGIASIPILGALFRSKGVNLSNSELIVIVTPTLVDPLMDKTVPHDPEPVRPFLNKDKFDAGFPPAQKP